LNGFANLTWLDALDKANNKPIVGSAAQMAKLGLDYFVAGDWRLGLWLNYIGERNREPYDARGNLPAYMLTNFTANYSGAIKGLTISLGVENLADIDYRFPSPINGDLSDLNQTVGNSEYIAAYPEDYSGVGRQVWLKARYQF
jgi:outer membrane receptor protein involved in Fe transport